MEELQRGWLVAVTFFFQDRCVQIDMTLGARWSWRQGNSNDNSSSSSSTAVLHRLHLPEGHSLTWSVIGLG